MPLIFGPDFASAVLDDIGMNYRICCPDGFALPDGAFITISTGIKTKCTM